MAASGPPIIIPIPPSESSPRELYKHRFMDVVTTPEKPVAQYGDWRIAIVVAVMAVVLVAGAVAYSFLVVGTPHVSVSDVTMAPGTCNASPDGSYSSSTLVYNFTLTNLGSRNAVATLDFYADGQVQDTSLYNPVPAGHAIRMTHSVDVSFCNPTTGTVLVRSAFLT